MHIGKNGWLTRPTRPYDRPTEVLETTIRTVHDPREPVNITHYALVDLRDADSANPASFYPFSLLRDDYTPQPAYAVYKQLVRELST